VERLSDVIARRVQTSPRPVVGRSTVRRNAARGAPLRGPVRRVRAYRLAGVVAALALAGTSAACGGANDPVTFPADHVELVASWSSVGGMTPTSYRVMQPPLLMVYSDGQAVANARRVVRLSPTELTSLVRDLRGDLRGMDNATSDDARNIADGASTMFQVRLGDGTLQTLSFAALGSVHDYPSQLDRADDRMGKLYKRADGGSAYRSDRVRLALDPNATGQGAPERSWPAAVAVPATDRYGMASADLAGEQARAVVAGMPDAQYQAPAPWPLYRRPDGTRYAVAWRYLGPEEPPL
jgi:hypothetical protein